MYVDIAGWHLFLRDMNAVPGFKMSQALATQLGPEVGFSGRSEAAGVNWRSTGSCVTQWRRTVA